VNLVLLEPRELNGSRARVEGRRATHLALVHRAAAGRRLRAGVVGGRVGHATVVAIDGNSAELEVELESEPPSPLPCTLVLALPRPKVLRRLLGAVAAFGIKRLVLIGSERVEKSYWQSPVLQEAALREELLMGLEQGCDTVLPVVTQKRLFRPFVEDELPGLTVGTLGLVAHPAAATSCPRAVPGPVTLVVGPEGGFNRFEVGLLVSAGLRPVALSSRPLRVEHAVAALLGRLF